MTSIFVLKRIMYCYQFKYSYLKNKKFCAAFFVFVFVFCFFERYIKILNILKKMSLVALGFSKLITLKEAVT